MLSHQKIDEYIVVYSSNAIPPRILLKGAGKIIGHLVFKPNGRTLPPNSKSGGVMTLYYHLDDFQNAIDLLRNEKPLYLLGSSNSAYGWGIQTVTEEIGEEEKV